jgi:periplasmic divalent cation tolerance protein
VQYSLLYVPVSSKDFAVELSTTLLNKKLIACANVIENGVSLYWWKDDVEQSKECYLILKTVKEKVEDVRSLVEELHTYDTPCIAEIEIKSLNEKYAKWIDESMR